MTQPHRPRRTAHSARRGHPPPRSSGPRRTLTARPAPGPTTPPRTASAAAAATTRAAPTGLTVAAVVPSGAVVGLDDSTLVHALLDDLVEARPSLVGTASLAAVIALSATEPARGGELTVRLFGGELRASNGAFTGPTSLQAITSTHCDVALVGGRVVGDDVWVPDDAAIGRRALLLAAHRAYLVVAAHHDHAGQDRTGWTRLAARADFDGVLLSDAPPERPGRSAAA